MKKTFFCGILLLTFLYSAAQSKKELARAQSLLPIVNLYDSLLHTGTGFSVTQFNGVVTSAFISIKGIKNKEFNAPDLTDTAFINAVHNSGMSYEAFSALIKLISVYDYCSLGVAGAPGNPEYEISVGYKWNKWITKDFFYRFAFGANANARTNTHYKKITGNIYKGSGISR